MKNVKKILEKFTAYAPNGDLMIAAKAINDELLKISPEKSLEFRSNFTHIAFNTNLDVRTFLEDCCKIQDIYEYSI